MDEYHGRATELNLNRGFETVETQAMGANKDEFGAMQSKQHKQQQMNQKRESIVFAVYECIRDAVSTENIRAIQDSEGQVSQEQKRMVKMLVA